MTIRTYVATKNAGKLREIEQLLRGSQLDVTTFAQYADVEEGDDSYALNAERKARALFAQLQAAGIEAAVLADDSGIEVSALDGRPGVLSARYAGVDATWDQRRARLLEEMRDVADRDRQAKFCCAVLLLTHDGNRYAGYGEVDGWVTRTIDGHGGFGYDPVFYYPPAARTFAQLSEEEKNRVSHRARAIASLLQALERG